MVQHQRIHVTGFDWTRSRLRLPVLAAALEKIVEHRFASATRGQISAIRLVNGPRDAIEVNLRPALLAIDSRKLLEADTCLLHDRQRGALVAIIFPRHPQHAS